MNPGVVQLILALLPMAEKLVFSIGGQLMELDTKNLTREDLVAALENSRSETWPELKFISPRED